jgi:hypothetical protein
MNTADSPGGLRGPQDPAGGYPPYPQCPPKPERPPGPRSLRVAVAFMYAGLAGSVINMIIWAVGAGAVTRTARSVGAGAVQRAANDLAAVWVGAAAIIGLVSAGLWLRMALANRRGQSWARIASTVLFGVYTLAALFGSVVHAYIAAPDGSRIDIPPPAAGILAVWLIWLIGLGAIIALWQPATTDHFTAVKWYHPANLVSYPGPAYGPSPYGAAPVPPGYGFAPPAPAWNGPAAPGPALSPPQAPADNPPPASRPGPPQQP